MQEVELLDGDEDVTEQIETPARPRRVMAGLYLPGHRRRATSSNVRE